MSDKSRIIAIVAQALEEAQITIRRDVIAYLTDRIKTEEQTFDELSDDTLITVASIKKIIAEIEEKYGIQKAPGPNDQGP